MIRLSKEKICSYVGDVLPIWLDGVEDDDSEIRFSVEGDSVTLRSFDAASRCAFSWGALLTLVAVGTSLVHCEYHGKVYTATVEVREMRTAAPGDELHYYLGDMHDHTSMNHNTAEFAKHEQGDITDYIDYQNNDARLDFAVISDHGGTNPGDGSGGVHGGWSDPEKLTTFAAVGRGVKSGAVEEMNVRDLAAIVLYALGIEPPAFDERGWTAQIPGGIFEDAAIPAYRDISHLTGAAPRISKAPHTSQLV
jgi:hypothetical protein